MTQGERLALKAAIHKLLEECIATTARRRPAQWRAPMGESECGPGAVSVTKGGEKPVPPRVPVAAEDTAQCASACGDSGGDPASEAGQAEARVVVFNHPDKATPAAVGSGNAPHETPPPPPRENVVTESCGQRNPRQPWRGAGMLVAAEEAKEAQGNDGLASAHSPTQPSELDGRDGRYLRRQPLNAQVKSDRPRMRSDSQYPRGQPSRARIRSAQEVDVAKCCAGRNDTGGSGVCDKNGVDGRGDAKTALGHEAIGRARLYTKLFVGRRAKKSKGKPPVERNLRDVGVRGSPQSRSPMKPTRRQGTQHQQRQGSSVTPRQNHKPQAAVLQAGGCPGREGPADKVPNRESADRSRKKKLATKETENSVDSGGTNDGSTKAPRQATFGAGQPRRGGKQRRS